MSDCLRGLLESITSPSSTSWICLHWLQYCITVVILGVFTWVIPICGYFQLLWQLGMCSHLFGSMTSLISNSNKETLYKRSSLLSLDSKTGWTNINQSYVVAAYCSEINTCLYTYPTVGGSLTVHMCYSEILNRTNQFIALKIKCSHQHAPFGAVVPLH